MTNAISKLHDALETWSFRYNCYEAVHPWTPFCSESALEIGLTVFGEAFKLYTPLYLYFTGKFYYYAVAYFPGFLASAMAVLIEKPNRRSSLAFYCANVASETLFRIYVARGYVRPVKNGQVYIFTLAISTLMMLAKRNGFEDDPLSAAIKLVVGPEEARPVRRRRGGRLESAESAGGSFSSATTEHAAGSQHSRRCSSSGQLDANNNNNNQEEALEDDYKQQSCRQQDIWQRIRRSYVWLKFFLTTKHRLCPHENCSCAWYVAKASLKAMLIGYAAQYGLKLSARIMQIPSNPRLVLGIASDPDIYKIGLFLSLFSGLFKATNCWLRWQLDTWKPLNNFIAGLVAGPAFFIYPSPTIALYVLWKCLENLFHEAARNNYIGNKDAYIVAIYALATSQLFYSALMDPRYMKKSYMSFLDRMSHHRLHMVNRSVLDIFGTDSSAGYEDFFPDLHPKFMSPAFLSTIWIWMIEQKFVAKHLTY